MSSPVGTVSRRRCCGGCCLCGARECKRLADAGCCWRVASDRVRRRAAEGFVAAESCRGLLAAARAATDRGAGGIEPSEWRTVPRPAPLLLAAAPAAGAAAAVRCRRSCIRAACRSSRESLGGRTLGAAARAALAARPLEGRRAVAAFRGARNTFGRRTRRGSSAGRAAMASASWASAASRAARHEGYRPLKKERIR